VDWYRKNKRDLPWRNIKDPYCIWISEIILQQTRVVQGYGYYQRFIQRFPDVESLSSADQEEVLKYWQGLGYYSRARNLHEAAKVVMSDFNGAFPQDYKDILSLKGIGEYTAAAIVSFVWNQPYPVVDGNVFRVLSRLFAIDTPIDTGVGKKQIFELAQSLMDPKYAGLHNQAIMEFGALQCVPQNPNCGICPFVDRCLGYASGNVLQFPVKRNKTKIRNRYFNYFFITYGGNTYLQRRSGKDIWEGLFEFPLIETDGAENFEALKTTERFKALFDMTGQPVFSIEKAGVKHALSHQVLYVTFYRVEIQVENKTLTNYLRVPISSIDNYPVSQLIHSYLISK
jgi:A/G-specific adenine glycosylase